MSTDKTYTAALVITLAMLIGIIPCYGDPKPPPAPPSSPSPSTPSEKFDLKGFYLGMSKKDVKAAGGKKMICFPSKEVNCITDNFCAIEGLSVAGAKTGSTIFMIKNDRLTGFTISFSRENFADIAEAFTSKYGKAQKTETQTVKNRLGSSFEKVELEWAIKDASVALSNMEDNVNEGQLSVRPIRPSDQMLECLAKEAKAAQNDL
jgi:hypothetical protein